MVFRVVLANPLTTDQILFDVLEEQQQVAALDKEFLPKIVTNGQRERSLIFREELQSSSAAPVPIIPVLSSGYNGGSVLVAGF